LTRPRICVRRRACSAKAGADGEENFKENKEIGEEIRQEKETRQSGAGQKAGQETSEEVDEKNRRQGRQESESHQKRCKAGGEGRREEAAREIQDFPDSARDRVSC
jgi:hypothetical protein